MKTSHLLVYVTNMEKVYVAMKGSTMGGIKELIGIFSDKDKARTKALKQPSYSYDGWAESLGWKDRWDNGAGYFVMVAEYTVE